MQKITDFLEKNVQWLVLGLGGLVLLMMVWSYLVQAPVVVEANGKQLLPGEIDQQTVQGPVQEFKRKIAPGNGESEIAWKMPAYEVEFKKNANPEKMDYLTLATLIPQAKPVLERFKENVILEAQPSKPVENLPEVAAATFVSGNNGRSVVLLEDPKVKARRKPGDAPVAPVAADMLKKDMDWVTQGFDIDVTKLGESFKKAFGDIENLPPQMYETQVVYVELVREEKLPNGTWGNRTTVKPLGIHEQPAFPDPKDMQKVLEYAEWVAMHPELITQPPFYPVSETGGDLWAPPGTEVTSVAAPVPVAAPTPGRQPRPRAAPPYGGGRGAPLPPYGGGNYGGRGRNYALQDNDRPILLASGNVRPGGYGGYGGGGGGYGGYGGGYGGYGGRGGYGGGYGGYGGYPGGMPGMPGAGVPQGPAQTVAGPGAFNVTTVNQPVRVWAHDDSVQAGKTYRYAIYHYLRNPLFQTFPLTKTRELSDQYALKSGLSDWSDPVKITPKVNFFLAGMLKDKVRFEVFTWQNGTWKKKTIERAPGDLIADTTWTLVDLRKEGNENYVLLVNQGGQIQRRDSSSDRKSPLYLQLNGEAESAKGATAAANAVR